MSRFEVHVCWGSTQARSDAIGTLARRYPEVEVLDVELRDDGAERWTCGAPNITHLHRWIREQEVDAAVFAVSPGCNG
ncbi:MAG: hypothetical protein ABIO83_08265 [Ilumatobacteraceae bacterium]